MDEYTPTTAEVRLCTGPNHGMTTKHFDAWLAEHDREVERVAAERAWSTLHNELCIPGFVQCMIHANPYTLEGQETTT